MNPRHNFPSSVKRNFKEFAVYNFFLKYQFKTTFGVLAAPEDMDKFQLTKQIKYEVTYLKFNFVPRAGKIIF